MNSRTKQMDDSPDIEIEVDRELFFHIGRALQRGIGKSLLGDVVLSVRSQTLTINSDWGGGELACSGGSDIEARLTAKAFCRLITTRCSENQPHGTMGIFFRAAMKEVAIDRIGVRARFITK
jgi:hypothetical protein